MTNNEERPPIGIYPRFIWIAKREEDILSAIQRYRDANYEVPAEWYDELVYLRQILKDVK